MVKTILATVSALVMAAPMALAASEAFTKADADRSGTLTMEELKVVNPNVTDSAFQAADTDGDGALSEQEFSAAETNLMAS